MTNPVKLVSGGPRQRGGFAVGLIVGLLIGLTLALCVALYVTKVPIPFVNKVPQRSAGQDAAEAEKNKDWNPNLPLYGKNPARPLNSASGVVAAPPVEVAPAPTAAAPATHASAPVSSRDPAALLADRPARKAPEPSPPAAAIGTGLGVDPFTYFVQAGAYSRPEDADQQRARLAIMGLEGRISERDQSGRTVYRVRLGPFEQRAEADGAKEKLVAAGVEAQLVRVQR